MTQKQVQLFGVGLLFICSTAVTPFTASAAAKPNAKPGSRQAHPNYAPNGKPTICSMTINSSEEIDTFKKSIGEKNANFVELTTLGTDDDTATLDETKADSAQPSGEPDDWFQKACKAKIKCDVLVISGHYGGAFFGKSGLSLPLEKLETASCSATCDGILEQPKEVYLFGCNTLAGKTKDRRSPEQYRTALINDGIPQDQAEQVVAYRYSPMGETNLDRMRLTFRGAKRIYGFDSIAPLGAHVNMMLKKYFSQVVPEGYFTSAKLNALDDSTNTKFATALKVTAITQATGAHGVAAGNVPACFLGDAKIPLVQKLTWAEKNLTSDQSFTYVPTINDFLSNLQTDGFKFKPDEKAVVDRIAANSVLRGKLSALIAIRESAMLTMQLKLLSFMKFFSWVTEADYVTRAESLLVGSLNEPFTLERKDQICSSAYSNSIHVHISASMVPAPRWLEPNFVSAITCITTYDESLLIKAVAMARSAAPNSDLAAAYVSLVHTMSPPKASAQIVQHLMLPKGDTLLSPVDSSLICGWSSFPRVTLQNLNPSFAANPEYLKGVGCYSAASSSLVTQYIAIAARDTSLVQVVSSAVSSFPNMDKVTIDDRTATSLVEIIAASKADYEPMTNIALNIKNVAPAALSSLSAKLKDGASKPYRSALYDLARLGAAWYPNKSFSTVALPLSEIALANKETVNAIAFLQAAVAVLDYNDEGSPKGADPKIVPAINKILLVMATLDAKKRDTMIEALNEIHPVELLSAYMDFKPATFQDWRLAGSLLDINDQTSQGRMGTVSNDSEIAALMSGAAKSNFVDLFLKKNGAGTENEARLIKAAQYNRKDLNLMLEKKLTPLLKGKDDPEFLLELGAQDPNRATIVWMNAFSKTPVASREQLATFSSLLTGDYPIFTMVLQWLAQKTYSNETIAAALLQVGKSGAYSYETLRPKFRELIPKITQPEVRAVFPKIAAALRSAEQDCQENPQSCAGN